MIDLSFKYREAINYLKKELTFIPDVAIILGSGLGDFANSSGKIKSINTSEIPGYPKSSIEGHRGLIHFSEVENKKVLIFQGRIHFYEGLKLSDCLLPVLLAQKLGCNKIILTNAAGGVNRSFSPGNLMLVNSFNAIQLKKEITRLIGLSSIEIRNNFLLCPSKKISGIFSVSAREIGIDLKSGTYWYTKGPSYETPAEIEMIRKFGGDAVGMSTVHEAIFASWLGIEVAAVSCITNMASGISPHKLSHTEVAKTAEKVADKFSLLLKTAISKL